MIQREILQIALSVGLIVLGSGQLLLQHFYGYSQLTVLAAFHGVVLICVGLLMMVYTVEGKIEKENYDGTTDPNRKEVH